MTIRPLRHRAALAAVVAVAAVTGLSACGSNNSSSSSSDENPQASAQQQVQDLTGRFMTVFSGVQTDPAKYQGQIEAVATGGAAEQMHQTAQNILARHFRATGSYTADHVTVLSTQLPGDNKAAGKKATAQVRLCYDPTGITVTQQDGNKVPTAPGILDHAQVTFTVVNAQYPDAQGWRVLRAQGGPKTPCQAS